MEEEGEHAPAVVIDNGSAVTKAGFAGNDNPCAVFPSAVGRTKVKSAMVSSCNNPVFVGNDIQGRRGILQLQYPIHNGIVTSWDCAEKLWHYTFYKALRVAPEEHPVLLTDVAMNPKANREKMTQIMFENHNVPAMYVARHAHLALYASGRNCGISFDSGFGTCRAVPVYEGYSMPSLAQQMDVAGRALTDHMDSLMEGKGHSLGSSALGRQVVSDIKEKFAYVALDFDSETTNTRGVVPSARRVTTAKPSHWAARCSAVRRRCSIHP